MDPFSGQKEKGDALRKLLCANPPGWQEVDGVKLPPITWADREEPTVERYYQIAFEAWQRLSTKPESRWEFADRMAKLGGADGEA